MTNYLSICTENGANARFAQRVELCDLLAHIGEIAFPSKTENYLLFPGFNDNNQIYNRNEKQGTMKMNVAILDADNKDGDKDLIAKFKEDMKEWEYVLYETSSSTKEVPKFRAFIPLDDTVPYNKWTKDAVKHIFSDYSDHSATWFFSIDSNHLNTLEIHQGKEFPSSIVMRKANNLMTKDVVEQHEYQMSKSINAIKDMRQGIDIDEKKVDVSNNEKVRHYLDTPYAKMCGNGDSDISLYRAICVCLAANDDATLDEVKNKALREKWTRSQIDRKIREASRFTHR